MIIYTIQFTEILCGFVGLMPITWLNVIPGVNVTIEQIGLAQVFLIFPLWVLPVPVYYCKFMCDMVSRLFNAEAYGFKDGKTKQLTNFAKNKNVEMIVGYGSVIENVFSNRMLQIAGFWTLLNLYIAYSIVTDSGHNFWNVIPRIRIDFDSPLETGAHTPGSDPRTAAAAGGYLTAGTQEL